MGLFCNLSLLKQVDILAFTQAKVVIIIEIDKISIYSSFRIRSVYKERIKIQTAVSSHFPTCSHERSSSSHLSIQIFHLAGHIFIFEFPHISSAFLDAFVSSGGTFQRLTQGVSHTFHVVRGHV